MLLGVAVGRNSKTQPKIITKDKDLSDSINLYIRTLMFETQCRARELIILVGRMSRDIRLYSYAWCQHASFVSFVCCLLYLEIPIFDAGRQ